MPSSSGQEPPRPWRLHVSAEINVAGPQGRPRSTFLLLPWHAAGGGTAPGKPTPCSDEGRGSKASPAQRALGRLASAAVLRSPFSPSPLTHRVPLSRPQMQLAPMPRPPRAALGAARAPEGARGRGAREVEHGTTVPAQRRVHKKKPTDSLVIPLMHFQEGWYLLKNTSH